MIEKILERLEAEKQRLEYQKNFFGERKNEEVVEEYGLKIFQMERVLKIVQEVAKEYGNGWIPCSERLPEPNTRVMACSNNGKIEIDAFGMASQKWLRATKEKVEIVAWQPIPQPFKGVE